jgi:ATP-dependent RNA helicase DeaD
VANVVKAVVTSAVNAVKGGVVMGVVLAANVVKAAHRVVMTLPVVVVSVVMRNHR